MELVASDAMEQNQVHMFTVAVADLFQRAVNLEPTSCLKKDIITHDYT